LGFIEDHLARILSNALAGRYAVERQLGQGGTARVFLARDLRHDRPVALKVLRPEIAGHIGAGRFLREIEIVARLQHPHILPLYDSGEAAGHLFFVMPFVEGESLRERLEREPGLVLGEALGIVRDVASALAFAHERGIVHRDVKPENIYLIGGSAVVADFGIARALSAAAEGAEARTQRLTDAGLAVGTPTYMSPEQASGNDVVDERSDIYALACVLFEMLAGEPPFKAFTPSGMLAAHISEEPPPLRQRAPDVPEAIARAVHRSLAKDPAARYRTVRAFADALHVSLIGARTRRRWALAGGAVGGLTAALAFGVFFGAFDPTPVNPDLHVVMPFAYQGAQPDSGLTAAQLGQLLHDAIGHWDDLTVVGPVRVYDIWARRGNPAPTLNDARRAATDLAAGRLAWAEVRESGDSLDVRAGLYDVAHRGRLLRELNARVPKYPRAMADVSIPMRRLANALVLTGEAPESVTVAPLGTQLLSAWRRFADGQAALQRWDLGAASAAFAEAARLDPGYAQAQLWAAQVATWADQPGSRWRPHAYDAVQNGRRLTSRTDSLRARALLALADSGFQESCDLYRRLIARDSLDATAWYGLGECQTRDPVVLRDRASPSGWRFRGNRHEGIEAYARALQLVPSFNFAFGQRAYDRLTRVLPVEDSRIVIGRALAPDTGAFAAFAGLDGDTLSFVPYPLRTLTRPATHGQGLTRNVARATRLVNAWVEAFPTSSAAHLTLGGVLERSDSLDSAPPARSALREVREARRLATDRMSNLEAAYAEARVLLKMERFGEARAVADSMLGSVADATNEEAERLATLSALVGRAHSAASLMARTARDSSVFAPDHGPVAVPRIVGELAMRLWAYSAMGGPPDSIRALRRALELRIASSVPRSQQATVSLPLFEWSDVLAFHVAGAGPAHQLAGGRPLTQLQRLISDGRIREAQLQSIGLLRPPDPSLRSVSPVSMLSGAQLALATGDTVLASRLLDGLLQRLPTLATTAFAGVEQAACLVRAMALRAELAARTGDRETAVRWVRNVAALWSAGDAETRAIVDRLRSL